MSRCAANSLFVLPLLLRRFFGLFFVSCRCIGYVFLVSSGHFRNVFIFSIFFFKIMFDQLSPVTSLDVINECRKAKPKAEETCLLALRLALEQRPAWFDAELPFLSILHRKLPSHAPRQSTRDYYLAQGMKCVRTAFSPRSGEAHRQILVILPFLVALSKQLFHVPVLLFLSHTAASLFHVVQYFFASED